MLAINILLALVVLTVVVCIEAYYALSCKSCQDPFLANLIATFTSAVFLTLMTLSLIPEVELSQLPVFLRKDNYSIYGLLLTALFAIPFFVFNLTVKRLLTRKVK